MGDAQRLRPSDDEDPLAVAEAEAPEETEGGEQGRTGLSQRKQRVATLLTQLATTARSFLLYDAHNVAIQRFIGTLLDSLVSTLRQEGQLVLDVQPFELCFEGEAVYLNRDRERSLAFRLYRDGVRSLKFRDGFDWEELARLLEVLSIRYTGIHQNEDDLVTLLWKARFEHLDVVAVEGFVPEDPESIDESALARESDSRLPADLDLPMPPPGAPSTPAWVDVADSTRDALRGTVSAASLADDCLLLLRRLWRVLDEPAERASLAEVAHLFGEVRDFLLSDENVESLARLIDILRELVQAPAPAWDPERARIAAELLASCADERAVRRLLHSVGAEERAPRPALIQVLDHACADPLAAVLAAHAAETGSGARSVARQLLVRYAPGKLEPLRERFEQARGHVALDLLQVIARLGGAAEALFCARQLSHADAEVQDEAVGCLEAMAYSGSMGRALLEAFRRSSGRLRTRVLALMERSRDRRFVGHLVDDLERDAGALDAAAGAEIGHVLGRLAGADGMARWQEWLRPSGLLHKGLRGPLALQVAAAAALAEVPGEQALRSLRAALAAAGAEAGPWIGQALGERQHGPGGRMAS
jgi:hypothetical protein